MLEPTFSDHSYGFRPGRSAHQAVKAMQQHINEGHRWGWSIWILAQFFDRVNHDVLMSLLARRHHRPPDTDPDPTLSAKPACWTVGWSARDGKDATSGPLSPLLSNVLLTELDRELERRGHRFLPLRGRLQYLRS
ncbi:reverse transcriptase domain-containing protein [Marinobacter sp. Arc7-DN-1]|uniref:reverse transcriptase domain-containing protein n=1 Tax=Marinobacter sp. Arc7-DN-1 TaxID=2304594 RepID=UPI001D0DBF53|nr:reverse transcriptase domain-containing protein [Marinobacter sp. Arc7-DN-1]